MKYLIGLMLSLNLIALPELESSVDNGLPRDGRVLVLKDSDDANLYYILPNHFEIAENLELPGEQYVNWFVDTLGRGHLQFNMVAAVTPTEYQTVVDHMKGFNPSARFAAVPIRGGGIVYDSKIPGISLNTAVNYISMGAYTPVDLVVQKSSARILINNALSSLGFQMSAYLNLYGVNNAGTITTLKHQIAVMVSVRDPAVFGE